MNKIAWWLMGASIGAIVALYVDMFFFSGDVVAQMVHHKMPECSRACHE